jgi:hypothetical protein
MKTKELFKILVMLILILSVNTESPATISVTGSQADRDSLQAMLQCAAFPQMPAQGHVQIDTAGNITMTGLPSTTEFGKRLKQILDDTTSITVTLEKVKNGRAIFIGAYNGGTLTNDKGNGMQSIDICDLKRLTKAGLMGMGSRTVYLMHELWEQYVASKYCLVFTQAHDSAKNIEAKVISSLNGGTEYRRIGDLRRGRCLFFVYQRTDSNQRVGIKFILSQFLQVDSTQNGLIDNFKLKHITNGCSGGLCSFNETDVGVTFGQLNGTEGLSGSDYLILDDEGDLYGSIPAQSKVVRLNHNGIYDVTYQHSDLVSPSGLAFNTFTKELFVACNNLEHVVVFSESGTHLRTLNIPGLSIPAGLDLDPEGNLYISSHGSDSIIHVTPAGEKLNTFGHPSLQGPAGLVFGDGSETLFVVSNTNHKVITFDAIGTFIEEFASGSELNSPWGIALEGDNFDKRFPVGDFFTPLKRVVVTSTGTNSLVAYKPDGTILRTFSQSGVNPSAVVLENDFDFIPVSVKNISSTVPERFTLEQNYPNPFNPSTKIRFALKNSSLAKLIVYDVTGRQIAILVNEKLSPGIYEHTFDARKLSSGIYFYRLEADGFIESKKMLFIK